jgi:pimeloyl-ACP methyl ester carboxylesterase
MLVHTRYVDTPGGVVHLRELLPPGAVGPPLVCLHPCPFSGLYFSTVMPLLAQGRAVLAPDYPGHGGSALLPLPPTITDYAAAMWAALPATSAMHLLGFHSGCLVALEMALLAPQRVAQLVLVDVPYFSAEVQAQMRQDSAQPMDLSDAASVATAWQRHHQVRQGRMPPARSVELFAEHIRAAPHAHLGFAAAFSYDCQARFAALQRPLTVVATQSALLQPTRAAAAALPQARLLERLDVQRAVFEEAAAVMANVVNSCLNN